MITPQFSVRQDENRVYIDIRVLHIRSASKQIEFSVNDELFIFSLPPYYLRLRFPGPLLSDEDEQVIEDDQLKSQMSYDASTCVIHLSISKKNRGENFPDLDLVAKLLARTSSIANTNEGNDPKVSTESIEEQAVKQASSAIKGISNPLIQELDDENNVIISKSDNDIEENNDKKVTASDIDIHFSNMAEEAENHNWEIDQQDPGRIPEDLEMKSSEAMQGNYGFNHQYSGIMGVSLEVLSSTFSEQSNSNGIGGSTDDANDVVNVESSTPESRHQLRWEMEGLCFDPDYYLSDLFETPDELESYILKWKSEINTQYEKLVQQRELKQLPALEQGDDSSKPNYVKFSQREKDYMERIVQERERAFKVNNSNNDDSNDFTTYYTTKLKSPRQIYIGLLCLLFAACYDLRTTTGDPTVESCWTISKICPLLSSLDDQFDTVQDAVVACLRRALCFPLYRHWGLSAETVWKRDVYQLLRLGKRRILKVLLELKYMFESMGGSSEGSGAQNTVTGENMYFVYSKLWLDDYILWLMYGAQENVLRSLAHEVHVLDFSPEPSKDPKLNEKRIKHLVGFELDELEEAAREAIQEAESNNTTTV